MRGKNGLLLWGSILRSTINHIRAVSGLGACGVRSLGPCTSLETVPLRLAEPPQTSS